MLYPLILALGAPTSPDSKFSFSPIASCGASSAAKRRLDMDDEDEDDDEKPLDPPNDITLTCVQSYCGCTCTIENLFTAGCGCANPVCLTQAAIDAAVLAAGSLAAGGAVLTMEQVCNAFGRPSNSCSSLNSLVLSQDVAGFATTVDCVDPTVDQRAAMCLAPDGR